NQFMAKKMDREDLYIEVRGCQEWQAAFQSLHLCFLVKTLRRMGIKVFSSAHMVLSWATWGSLFNLSFGEIVFQEGFFQHIQTYTWGFFFHFKDLTCTLTMYSLTSVFYAALNWLGKAFQHDKGRGLCYLGLFLAQ